MFAVSLIKHGDSNEPRISEGSIQMTYEEVRNQLLALTSGNKEVMKYFQTDRIHRNPALRGRVSDGFCSGACMDWLQLVLQGGNAIAFPTISGLPWLTLRPQDKRIFTTNGKNS